jgi:hypothetical protein
MEKRPAIPAELTRRVLVEAGHRCAIPTCRHPTTEIAHIVPWSRVREHTFDNLIALCPTCHARYDKGEIDRKSMRMYKAQLSERPTLSFPNRVEGEYDPFKMRILGDHGITSITDNGIGDYTVNLALARSDNEYPVLVSAPRAQFEIEKGSTSFRVRLLNSTGGSIDAPFAFKLLGD